MQESNNQTTLISFFRFENGNRVWAMSQMFFTQRNLKGKENLLFHKMLGTGGGDGYSSKPDFKTYALLTVWNDESEAIEFEAKSEIMSDFRAKSSEVYSLFLRPIRSRGLWSGQQPFQPSDLNPENKLVTVLTRATLKTKYYYHFWKRVGGVSAAHVGLPGLVFSKGVGERPWIMQATFSTWRSVEEMEDFAHGEGGKHLEAIQTTRRMNGFKEELYARFQPYKSTGSWHGQDPVGEELKKINAVG